MSVVKVIEILSNSPTSWEDATQQGVSHAAKTIRNIKSAYVSNFTAGISGIRTSPDHGTAFDIAGQNKADESSFRAAIFTCVDILNNRRVYDEHRKNPLKKMSAAVVANAVDEKIVEDSE